MSEWKRDPSAGDTSGWAPLVEELRRLRARVSALETRAPLSNASIGEGGLRIHGNGAITVESGSFKSGDFDGNLDTGDAGTTGWAFDRARAAMPELLLRPGSIGNDKLTNPVRGDVMLANASGFSLTTDYTVLASQTWQVPSGFTRVAVSVLAKVFAYNPTAGLDYLYARPRIVRVSDGADIAGTATPTAASGANGSGTSIAPGVAVIEFDAGDSVRLEIQGRTAFGPWAANVGNGAEIAGSLTWYR